MKKVTICISGTGEETIAQKVRASAFAILQDSNSTDGYVQLETQDIPKKLCIEIPSFVKGSRL